MFRLPMGAMTTLFFNVMRLTRIGEKDRVVGVKLTAHDSRVSGTVFLLLLYPASVAVYQLLNDFISFQTCHLFLFWKCSFRSPSTSSQISFNPQVLHSLSAFSMILFSAFVIILFFSASRLSDKISADSSVMNSTCTAFTPGYSRYLFIYRLPTRAKDSPSLTAFFLL